MQDVGSRKKCGNEIPAVYKNKMSVIIDIK